MTLATSSGSATSPSAVSSAKNSRPYLATAGSLNGVLTKPGATANAVTPSRPYWRAMVRVIATTPAFAAA